MYTHRHNVRLSIDENGTKNVAWKQDRLSRDPVNG